MGTKMKKGILKPLRYISHIFDDNKEPEMQIGLPTDVKHVAHIGWDGPKVNSTPSWMKDYHSAPLNSPGGEGKESPTTNSWGSQDFAHGGIEDPSDGQTLGHSGLSSSVDPSPNSLDLVPASTKPRHSRRRQSDGSMPTESPGRDSADGPKRSSRKPRKKEAVGPSDSPAQDMPAIPKQSHRRKNKGSSTAGGSVKSKSKAATSAGGATDECSSTKPSSSLLPTASAAGEKDYEV